MSAQLANSAASSTYFSARLALAAGVMVTIDAPSLTTLSETVGKLQPTEAANDTPAPTTGKSKPAATPAQTAAATAPAGASASPTAASSAPAAAAQAAQGEAGNATSAAGQPAAAQTASSEKPAGAAEVSFDTLKKAFLALSTKADGRAKCENVLKPFGLAKLSEAKPEQYAAVLAAIEEASK